MLLKTLPIMMSRLTLHSELYSSFCHCIKEAGTFAQSVVLSIFFFIINQTVTLNKLFSSDYSFNVDRRQFFNHSETFLKPFNCPQQ